MKKVGVLAMVGTLGPAVAGYAVLGSLGAELARRSGSGAVPDRALLSGRVPITDVAVGYDEPAAQVYRTVLLVDMVVPVFAVAFTVLAVHAALPPSAWRRRAAGAVALALPFDWCENLGLLAALQRGATLSAAVAWATTAASAGKWAALGLGYVLIAVGVTRRLASWASSVARTGLPGTDRRRQG